MKRILRSLAVLLCLSMLLSLVACGRNGKDADTPSPNTNDTLTRPEWDKMEYFQSYVSNTLAGTSNQLYFDNTPANGAVSEGMMFYKATVGGEYEYSLLFSNAIDTTFAEGDSGVANMKLEDFEITGVKIGVMSGNARATPQNAERKVTFISTAVSKYTHTNGVTYFETAPVKLDAAAGDYIVVVVAFTGSRVPCHVESLIPTYKKENGSWSESKYIPLANMVGIKRAVKATVAYLGDSITQGIGVDENDYSFWSAVTSQKLGNDFAYWNLGIGYARCSDAATDGSWLFKAKQAEYVIVCLGTNDIASDYADGPTLCADLEKVVDALNDAGCRVIVQMVPPFTYEEYTLGTWFQANDYIRNTLSQKVVAVFDQSELLMTEEKMPNKLLYGGHPNKKGCKVWGEALYAFLTANVEGFQVK